MALYLQFNQTKFQIGDTVKVHQKIIEGNKSRTQVFEGVVIKIKGHQNEKTFTVRKVSSGIGVERIWPVDSPFLEKIEVSKKGKVRRAKLYYLRNQTGRDALKVNVRRDTKANNDKDKKSKPPTKAIKVKTTSSKKTTRQSGRKKSQKTIAE